MKETLFLKNYAIHVDADWADFDLFLNEKGISQVVLICDHNTFELCLPVFQKKSNVKIRSVIQLEAGEKTKSLGHLEFVFEQFSILNLDRKSLVVLLGGGVIGDLGGFAAACWKRGIPFVQMPTTLLSMVDSSIGGKTGIDFGGVKNVVGAFRDPEAVFIFPEFLATLSDRELRSGFAEMLKHALISDAASWLFFKKEIEKGTWRESVVSKIGTSLAVKKRIVEADPFEKGERAALNFGHTIGHALESFFLEKGASKILLHGEAIAQGMIAEAYLSQYWHQFSRIDFWNVSTRMEQVFGKLTLNRVDFPAILALMRQDKKNDGDQIKMALLGREIGQFRVGCAVPDDQILNALDAVF